MDQRGRLGITVVDLVSTPRSRDRQTTTIVNRREGLNGRDAPREENPIVTQFVTQDRRYTIASPSGLVFCCRGGGICTHGPLRLYVMIVSSVGFARFFVAPACGLVACSGCAALPGAVPSGPWPDSASVCQAASGKRRC